MWVAASDGMRLATRIVHAISDRDRSHRPTVYVADDDVATLALLHDLANDAGWDARGFTRLASLRRAIDQQPPSLLILDDDLPDGRGGDLARELRNDPRLAKVPLLVCTAAHPLRQAQIGGWAPVISKPFDLGAIERFLDASYPRAARSSSGDRAG